MENIEWVYDTLRHESKDEVMYWTLFVKYSSGGTALLDSNTVPQIKSLVKWADDNVPGCKFIAYENPYGGNE